MTSRLPAAADRRTDEEAETDDSNDKDSTNDANETGDAGDAGNGRGPRVPERKSSEPRRKTVGDGKQGGVLMLATPEFRSDSPDGVAGRPGPTGSAGSNRTHRVTPRPVSPRTDPSRFYSQRTEPVRPDPAPYGRSPSGVGTGTGTGPGPGSGPAAPSGELKSSQTEGPGGRENENEGEDEDERTQPQRRRAAGLARATVVLDVRQGSYSPDTDAMATGWFELAVDATTSVALTAARTSFPVHLRTTANGDSPARAGDWSNVGEVLDWLAVVRPTRDGSLAAALAEAGRGRTTGELVVVSGTDLSSGDRQQICAMVGNFDKVLLIQIGPEAPEQLLDDKVRTLWARDAESLVLGWVKLVSG